MRAIVTIKTTLLGWASWVVPFVASFLFVEPSGRVVIPQPLFKSIMVVVFGGACAALLVLAYRHVEPTARGGLVLGCYWLAINLALDVMILVPLAGMSLVEYVSDIGLRYALIPIISTAIGVAAERTRPAPNP